MPIMMLPTKLKATNTMNTALKIKILILRYMHVQGTHITEIAGSKETRLLVRTVRIASVRESR